MVYFAKPDKVGMTEKIMSAIAAGWWVVTKRYVEKSFKQGSWIPSLKIFTWSPRVLERREAMFHEGVIKGGLFWTMKAVFIMEDKIIKDVFGRIVIAGGGSVVRYYNTLESLARNPPSVREIMHVFLDPWPKIIRSVEFHSVVTSCKRKNLNIHFLHYRYLYNLIDGKKNTTVDKWDITLDYVQNDTKLTQQTKESKKIF